MTTNPNDVVVIGGGLAGLTAAAYVARAGRSVTVHERSAAVGGRAATSIRDGFHLNQGPHALYRGGVGEAVLRELGVRIDGAPPSVAGRVVFDGREEIAPAGPVSLLRTGALGLKGKAEIGRLLGALRWIDATEWAGRSVSDWVESSVRQPRSRQLLHALVRLATYVNEPDQLSAQVAVSQLQSALGSGVLYLDHGWQSLVDQLTSADGVTVQTGSTIDGLPDAPAVIVAVGDPASAARLVGTSWDLGPAATASCMDLGLSAAPDHDFVLGGDVPFYFSNHSAAANLAPDGMWHAAMVEYLRGDSTPDVDALQEFSGFAGVRNDDVVMRRRLHRMTTVAAMPTAAAGGYSGRPGVTDTGHQHVMIAGDWVGANGHLADASLASGREAAAAALDLLDTRAAVR